MSFYGCDKQNFMTVISCFSYFRRPAVAVVVAAAAATTWVAIRWLLSVMPYQPLGDEEAIKSTHIPPTFSIHKYSSAVGDPVGKHFGKTVDPQDHKRTQSVLRMGRTFSVRMSFQGKREIPLRFPMKRYSVGGL